MHTYPYVSARFLGLYLTVAVHATVLLYSLAAAPCKAVTCAYTYEVEPLKQLFPLCTQRRVGLDILTENDVHNTVLIEAFLSRFFYVKL